MCGINGFAGRRNLEVLAAMNAAQIHRGPDDEGFYVDKTEPVCLAMRRLSIIDVAHGHQPMRSEDANVVVVFNGEIFNAPELRKMLIQHGHRFTTNHSDTEAILNLYLHAGREMVSQLNGMFAFCIYNRRNRKFFAARDPFGIKPFFYSVTGDSFTFASELKSLLKCPWVGSELDRQAVYDFFTFQTIPEPHTIYSSVSKLPAGHCLEYNLDTRECKVWKYWQPSFHSQAKVPRSELKSQIRDSFVSAVQRWSQSDVPIACSLSGGIDSSAIVAALATTRSAPVDTYTVGFKQQESLDETAIARSVSQKWGTSHHELIIDIDDVLGSLDKMLHHLDEPYAGGLPSWFIYQAMQNNVKVAMTGTGGDELFGNYGKWRKFASRRDQFYLLRQYCKEGGRMAHAVRYPHGALHYPYFNDGEKDQRLFKKEFQRGLRPSAKYVEHLWPSRLSAVDAVVAVDSKLQLPEEFLMMTDRFSMAFSIEARTPFLDLDFASQVFAIPAAERTDAISLKKLFVESMGDLLPIEVTQTEKKGFTLPQSAWLRGGLRQHLLELTAPHFLKRQGIFQESVQAAFVDPFLKEQHNRHWESWNLLMFQLWYQARPSVA